MSTNEHIHCTDVVCICGKTAAHAAKVLSRPTFLRRRFAERTGSGGISGIDSNKTNTVLLRQHLDPCDSLPVCPRGDCLAKRLSSAELLAQLQVLQILNTEAPKSSPRQPPHLPVNVVFTCSRGTKTALAAGLTPAHASADGLDLGAVPVSVGVDEEFIDANIDSERHAWFWVGIGCLDPESSPAIAERATLKQLGSGLVKPMGQVLVALERDDDGLALDQPGDLENVVEDTFAGFDLGHGDL